MKDYLIKWKCAHTRMYDIVCVCVLAAYLWLTIFIGLNGREY